MEMSRVRTGTERTECSHLAPSTSRGLYSRARAKRGGRGAPLGPVGDDERPVHRSSQRWAFFSCGDPWIHVSGSDKGGRELGGHLPRSDSCDRPTDSGSIVETIGLWSSWPTAKRARRDRRRRPNANRFRFSSGRWSIQKRGDTNGGRRRRSFARGTERQNPCIYTREKRPNVCFPSSDAVV